MTTVITLTILSLLGVHKDNFEKESVIQIFNNSGGLKTTGAIALCVCQGPLEGFKAADRCN